METVCKIYDTRRKRRLVEPLPKTRVDWKRTKRDSVSHLLDSDESCTSEEESGEESDEDISSESSEDQDTRPPEEDDERIRKPRLRRTSGMIDSESSSDSDGPGGRATAKRSCVISDDDSDEEAVKEKSEDEETKAHRKKQKRMEVLKQLAQTRRSRRRTTSVETSEESPGDEPAPLTPETLLEGEDSDSDMSDFIVADDENNNGEAEHPEPSYKDLFRKHNISLSASHDLSSHLQKVIRAFLNDIIEKTFLTSIYNGDNKRKYARDMLNSLKYLDQRIIAPRLEKLTTSCRWTKTYQERVNSYPNLYVKRIAAEQMSCNACNLQRYCGYLVILSGQAYDYETLEPDDFLQDDRQKLVVGKTCANRTEAYHQLRHYKYFLYQRCIPFVDETKKGSTFKKLKLALSEMEAGDFLGMEIEFLDGYLNEADYFQEEAKDSLLG